MSHIDSYKHRHLGFLPCPTDHPSVLVLGQKSPVLVALYELKEPVAEWNAKAGDLVLGGGSGECPPLRISLPEAVTHFEAEGPPAITSRKALYQNYWGPEQAFALCNGFQKLGWRPGDDIETWLVERVLAFLSAAYPGSFPVPTQSEITEHGFVLSPLKTP